MVDFNPYTNKYVVFGKTLTEKRAKRDGRNPATGAFSTNSHTGVVDLTVDIPQVKGVKNVAIADKTGYTKKANSADLLRQNFIDKVSFEFTHDIETPANSTYILTDAYEQSISAEFEAQSGGNIAFLINDKRLIVVLDFPESVCFAIDGKTYVNGYLRRNTNGGLLVSGYELDTKILYSDIEYGKVFDELAE